MLALLPQVDAYIKNATGRDWAKESSIPEEAKSAARMLLVRWHENPSMSSSEMETLAGGLRSVFLHLEVLASRYHEFYGRDGAGSVSVLGLERGDTVDSLIAIIGESGDQSNAFEQFITVDYEIQQVSESDLSEVMFRVKIIPPEELV
jgi:hypothetical protein